MSSRLGPIRVFHLAMTLRAAAIASKESGFAQERTPGPILERLWPHLRRIELANNYLSSHRTFVGKTTIMISKNQLKAKGGVSPAFEQLKSDSHFNQATPTIGLFSVIAPVEP